MALQQIYAEQALPDKAGPVTLSQADCRALRSLAAYQLRYGATEEAVALLLAGRRLWPNDVATLSLLAQALLQGHHDEAAEAIMAEVERLDARHAAAGQSLLVRSILLFRRMRVAEARRAFIQFVTRRNQGVS